VQQLSVRSIKISILQTQPMAFRFPLLPNLTLLFFTNKSSINKPQSVTPNQQSPIKNPRYLLFVPHSFFSNNEYYSSLFVLPLSPFPYPLPPTTYPMIP
jgi:hypothetical protein